MGQVTLSIGGYSYGMPCRDGEEAHMLALGAILDQQANSLKNSIGTASEVRQLLMVALVLADKLQEPENGQNPALTDLSHLESLATQMENLALRLEIARQTP